MIDFIGMIGYGLAAIACVGAFAFVILITFFGEDTYTKEFKNRFAKRFVGVPAVIVIVYIVGLVVAGN